MNWKKLLIERLGNKCSVCSQEDIERLDVGFVNKQEYLEDQYFENKEEIYVWFVLHFKEESEYLTSEYAMNANQKPQKTQRFHYQS